MDKCPSDFISLVKICVLIQSLELILDEVAWLKEKILYSSLIVSEGGVVLRSLAEFEPVKTMTILFS